MPHSPPTTVVIADDEPEVRAALRDLIEGWDGIEVVDQVGTAEEAIASCAMHRPRIAIIDMRMPGEGLVATRKIAESGTADRVIVLTATDMPEAREDAYASGASFFVVKSVGDDLVDAIRNAAQ